MTVSTLLLSVASIDARPAKPSDPAPTLSFVEGKRSPPTTRPVATVVIGDKYIGPSFATRLLVRLRFAPVGSEVLSLPDSMRVTCLYYMGVLSLLSLLTTSSMLLSHTPLVLQ